MTFIVIEGQDYVGKSTQTGLLVKRLIEEGYNVYSTRSPGGCPDSEAIREFMLHSETASPDLRNILAGLSRQLTSKVINDFLLETPTYNKIAVSDRWITSGYAYQVCGEGVAEEKFIEANEKVLRPTLEIRLVMTTAERNKRKTSMAETNRDVMEKAEADPAFADRVRSAFSRTDKTYCPVQFVWVSADQSIKEIHELMWEYVSQVLV